MSYPYWFFSNHRFADGGKNGPCFGGIALIVLLTCLFVAGVMFVRKCNAESRHCLPNKEVAP